jgi:hypothetical protein
VDQTFSTEQGVIWHLYVIFWSFASAILKHRVRVWVPEGRRMVSGRAAVDVPYHSRFPSTASTARLRAI